MFILSMKQLQEKKDVLEKKTCRRFKSSNNGSCHFQIFQYSSRLSKEFMDPSASRKRYQSVLKSFQNNKKNHVFPQSSTIRDLVIILKKKQTHFLHFLLSNIEFKIMVTISCCSTSVNQKVCRKRYSKIRFQFGLEPLYDNHTNVKNKASL